MSKNLLEFPALLLRNGLGLDDADFIAYCGFAILIVGIEFLGPFNDLFETERFLYCLCRESPPKDGDRLGHLALSSSSPKLEVC